MTSEVFGSSGSKLYIVHDGEAHALADLHAFEVEHNPHPAAIDTDPFDVLNRGHGARAVVADAAGNDVILRITSSSGAACWSRTKCPSTRANVP